MDVTRMCLRATFDIQKRIYIPFCHMRFMSVSRTFQLLLLERITFDTHKRQRFFDHFVLTDMSARVRVRVSETKARTWGAASTSSSCLANPNPNPNPNPSPNPNPNPSPNYSPTPTPNPNPNPELTLSVSDLTLFYNPRPNPNTKSNSKSNPNPSSHRFVWRHMPFTLKMSHSPFAPARVTRSRKTKHMHKHYSQPKNLRADICTRAWSPEVKTLHKVVSFYSEHASQ